MDHYGQISLGLGLFQEFAHRASFNAGWWKTGSTDVLPLIRSPADHHKATGGAYVAQKLMLIVSEVSEAMEAHRRGAMDDKLPHRPGIEVELADTMIRIADLAGALQLDLAGAILEKMDYNRKRADHKPEARAAAGGKAY